MGIDRASEDAAGVRSYRNGGQADFLRLMAIDDERKQVSQIQVDRDTMAQLDALVSKRFMVPQEQNDAL